MDSRAPSGPRPRFGCDGSWLMASLANVSSMSFRFCLLKPSSTRRRTVSLFWSVVMVVPFYFAAETGRFAAGLVGTLPALGLGRCAWSGADVLVYESQSVFVQPPSMGRSAMSL